MKVLTDMSCYRGRSIEYFGFAYAPVLLNLQNMDKKEPFLLKM